ncbi:MAG TPA: aspartyl/asparaginyl beta-hydroxylase domain-containing protein [Isosphaeraceae bacterium]|jgi:aspartyl/asparaginyl beta-hydroxylase (cupin superfamily)
MGLNYHDLNLVALLEPLNRFYDLYTGGKHRPVFHDIDATRPELRELDRNFPAIREELMAVLPNKASIPRYHDIDPMQAYISAPGDPDKAWKIFYLHSMGDWPESGVAACPRTAELLKGIPGLFQAFFSILEAGKSIPVHEGPYRGYLRYHLGLLVPEQDPPSIRIKDQHYTWREGESMLFDDSWEHEVFNQCPQDRVVLIVDIRRPMPFPFGATNRAAQAIMRQLYGKEILKKLA